MQCDAFSRAPSGASWSHFDDARMAEAAMHTATSCNIYGFRLQHTRLPAATHTATGGNTCTVAGAGHAAVARFARTQPRRAPRRAQRGARRAQAGHGAHRCGPLLAPYRRTARPEKRCIWQSARSQCSSGLTQRLWAARPLRRRGEAQCRPGERPGHCARSYCLGCSSLPPSKVS